MSVNKVILIGNIGHSPEVRKTQTTTIVKFTLATSEKYYDKQGNKITNTDWHNIIIFGKLAEIAEKYLTKGQQVYVEGRLKTNSYEGKDGVKKYITQVYVDAFNMLGRKPEASNESHQDQPQNQEEIDFFKTEQQQSDDVPY